MFDKRLLALAPEARKHIAASVILQWVGLVATIALMLLLGAFLQELLADASEAVAGIPHAAAAAALAVVTRMACSTLAQKQGQAAAAVAKRVVRQRVYDKLVALGPAYAERVSTSEAVQVSIEGTEQLESYFGSYLPQLFYAVLAPLTLFAFLAPLCPPAAAVLIACVPLIPVSIMGVQKLAKRVMRTYWGSYTDLGAAFLESIQGLTTLKIYQADQARHEDMNRESERFRKATMRLLSMQLNSITIMDLLAYGGAAAGIVVVLWRFGMGAVAFGAAFSIVFLSAEFFLPMRMLGSFFHTAMNGMAAAEKMFTILDAPDPRKGTRALDLEAVDLACSGVSYSYDGERSVLLDVSLRAPRCGLVGIVGESGSGKTTLAGVLSGRIDGYRGTVQVGGVDARELSYASLMRAVVTVSAQSHLFKGTVRENLLLANIQARDEDLWRVLETCRLASLVRELGGLDAPVREQGSNLSGGQRQRLAVARALLSDAPAYVFDEATSNVDAESEQAILSVIAELAKRKSVIVISHRLAAVREATCIYVLEQGRLAEQGTHDELLSARGTYAHLWLQQEKLEEYSRSLDGAAKNNDLDGRKAHAYSADVDRGKTSNVYEPGFTPEPASACAGAAVTATEPDASSASGTAAAAGDPASIDERKRSHFSVMVRMLKLARPLALWMVLAVALGVLGFTAAIALTVLAAYALLDLSGMPQVVSVGAALAGIVISGLARGPLRYGEQMCNHYLAFKLLALVRDKVFAALRRLAPAKLEGRDKGDLVSLVTSDVELMEVFYAHTVSPVLIALVVSLGAAAFVASLSPVLGALALAAYLAVGVAVPLVASRAAGMGGRAQRVGIGSMNAFVLDSLRGLSETLQYGRGESRSRELAQRMSELAQVEKRLKGKAALFGSLANAFVMAFDVAMVLASSALYAAGVIDFGSAVIASAVLMSSFGPVVAVANLGSSLQQTIASGARVLDLLDERPQTEEIDAGVEVRGFSGIAAKQVEFSYGGARVLNGVDLSIEPGSVVHIAGRSGSGKSTFLKLLMRFWDVERGGVEVNDTDIRNVSTSSLRDAQSYMTQETHLFSGSIAQNILIAKQDATPDELIEACRKAALSDFTERLPHGLETKLGELGEGVSGGERQRIGLARAFLHDAPLMLLDEPTSNLDVLNEAAVLRALEQERGGKTVVLVSHRASTSAIADVAYEVGCGRMG